MSLNGGRPMSAGLEFSVMQKERASGWDPILARFGSAFQKRRQGHGISQEEAAVRASLCQTYFMIVERGKRNVGIRTLIAIARGLDFSLSVI